MSASAILPAGADQNDADVGKSRRDWRMRLVHRNPHVLHLAEAFEKGLRDGTGGALDKTIATGTKRLARNLHDLIITHSVSKLIGAGRFRAVDGEHQVEGEGVSDFRLV